MIDKVDYSNEIAKIYNCECTEIFPETFTYLKISKPSFKIIRDTTNINFKNIKPTKEAFSYFANGLIFFNLTSLISDLNQEIKRNNESLEKARSNSNIQEKINRIKHATTSKKILENYLKNYNYSESQKSIWLNDRFLLLASKLVGNSYTISPKDVSGITYIISNMINEKGPLYADFFQECRCQLKEEILKVIYSFNTIENQVYYNTHFNISTNATKIVYYSFTPQYDDPFIFSQDQPKKTNLRVTEIIMQLLCFLLQKKVETNSQRILIQSTKITFKKDKTSLLPSKYFLRSDTLEIKKANRFHSKNHQLIPYNGIIPLRTKEGQEEIYVTFLNYCIECKKFYISEQNFVDLLKVGKPLCIVNYYGLPSSKGKKEFICKSRSILNEMGYNVQAKNGLSYSDRQAILTEAISKKIISVNDTLDFLTWLIKTKEQQPQYYDAVGKWKDDISYIYKTFWSDANSGKVSEINVRK